MYDNLIVLPMMYHLFITHRLNFTFMIFLKRILRFGEVWNKPERLKLIPKINSTALLLYAVFSFIQLSFKGPTTPCPVGLYFVTIHLKSEE